MYLPFFFFTLDLTDRFVFTIMNEKFRFYEAKYLPRRWNDCCRVNIKILKAKSHLILVLRIFCEIVLTTFVLKSVI